jgi:hypothetical protein
MKAEAVHVREIGEQVKRKLHANARFPKTPDSSPRDSGVMLSVNLAFLSSVAGKSRARRHI